MISISIMTMPGGKSFLVTVTLGMLSRSTAQEVAAADLAAHLNLIQAVVVDAATSLSKEQP